MSEQTQPTCLWQTDPDSYQASACGQAYTFEYPFKVNAAYTFCPGCGKRIEVMPVKVEEEQL